MSRQIGHLALRSNGDWAEDATKDVVGGYCPKNLAIARKKIVLPD